MRHYCKNAVVYDARRAHVLELQARPIVACTTGTPEWIHRRPSRLSLRIHRPSATSSFTPAHPHAHTPRALRRLCGEETTHQTVSRSTLPRLQTPGSTSDQHSDSGGRTDTGLRGPRRPSPGSNAPSDGERPGLDIGTTSSRAWGERGRSGRGGEAAASGGLGEVVVAVVVIVVTTAARSSETICQSAPIQIRAILFLES